MSVIDALLWRRPLSAIFFPLLIAPFASAADKQVVVACGASVQSYCAKSYDEVAKKAGLKVEGLREGGLGADSIAIAVERGRAELGISGNSWESTLKLLKEKNMLPKDPSIFKTRVLGNDRVKFVVWNGGPSKLTNEQLAKALTGDAKNWKELGFEDAPIVIVLPNNTPATQKTISTSLLSGREILQRGAKTLEGFESVVKLVATTKGAISFVSGIIDTGKATTLSQPEVLRTVTAITNGAPSERALLVMESIEKQLK